MVSAQLIFVYTCLHMIYGCLIFSLYIQYMDGLQQSAEIMTDGATVGLSETFNIPGLFDLRSSELS